MIGEFVHLKRCFFSAFYLERMEEFQMKIGQMNLGNFFRKVIWPGPPNGRVVLFDSVQKEIPKSNHLLVCLNQIPVPVKNG